jgi:predicted  nucleic acid-binding Zn-ribbon protein
MPHKCTKCGREYRDGSTEILKGCTSCGNKKFLYVREEERNRDMLDEKSIEEIAHERQEQVLEVKPDKVDRAGKKAKFVEMHDRVETVRILTPGSYELNLEKMAKSDERIVRVNGEGTYRIDLLSMAPKKKRSRRKKKPENDTDR